MALQQGAGDRRPALEIRPRSEFWAPRWVTGAGVRHRIAELDPVEHDAEITHLSLEVMTPPMMAHIGYASAAAQTVAVPRVADRLYRDGQGDQILRPAERDADTLTYFGVLIRYGHRSPEGRAACEHIQQIHSAVKGVLNEDQIYTLAALIFFSQRLARAMGSSFYSERENAARFSFWMGIGRAMRLRNVPETPPELEVWMLRYEEAHFAPSEAGHQVAEAHVRAIERWFPGPTKRLARSVYVATMDDRVRECLGYQPPQALLAAAERGAWRTTALLTPARLLRLDSSWAKSFSRAGPNPNLEQIGYGSDR